ncbi:MAG: hypothetical protein JNL79_27510 [Myxococcales bacterium]|nr:hypothetical protein [Myxococcales bacterium]
MRAQRKPTVLVPSLGSRGSRVVIGHATGHNGAAPNCTGNVVSASNATVNASL